MMTKNSRLSFALAALILLLAAALRLYRLDVLPLGLNAQEIIDIRLAENARQGDVQLFYEVNGQGRDILYPVALAAVSSITGPGSLGYHVLSAWLSVVTVALVYALAKRLYGDTAGLAAMSLMSYTLFAAFLGRLALRETLLPALVAAVLLAVALAFPVYWRLRSATTKTTAFAALAALLGGGLYLHPAGLMVALVVLVYVAYILFVRRTRTPQMMSYLGFSLLIAAIIATPYIISSARLPQLSGITRLINGFSESPQPILERMLAGFAGLFWRGDANAMFNVPGRPLIDPVSTLLIVVGVVVALRSWRKPRYALVLIAVLLLVPIPLLAPESPLQIAYAAVLPVLALLFGLGAAVTVRQIRPRWLPRVALTALVMANFAWTFIDLFSTWPQNPDVRAAYQSDLAQIAHHIDVSAWRVPTVICARGATDLTPQAELSRGSLLSLMINRQNTTLRYVDCDNGLVFVNGGDQTQQIMFTDRDLPTTSADVEAWFAQGQALDAASIVPEAGVTLSAGTTLADLIGKFQTTAPYVFAPEVETASPQLAPPVSFENNLTYLGYVLPTFAYGAGDTLTLVTYWRVDGALPPDLTLFTHVLDDPGAAPVANSDTIAVLPSQLQNRDVLMQVTTIPLPQTMPSGEYVVSVGAYRTQSGERLRVLDNGQPRGNRLILLNIEVTN